jgi:hypothetical protein
MPIPDEQQLRRLEMDGWYSESESGQALRQPTLAELSGTCQAARSYLGRESIFAHR